MPDPITFITQALSAIDKLRKLNAKMQVAEAKLVIAELQNALADTKIAVAELKAENLNLREASRTAMASSAIADDLELRGDAYYRRSPREGRPKGPYCVNCFDQSNKLVLLTAMSEHFHIIATHQCPQCENKVTLKPTG